MFDTEIIDSSKDKARETVFGKIFKLFDFWLSSLGFILLVAAVTYFLQLAPLVATGMVLMFLLLSFVIILLIKFSHSRRINFGRIILSDDLLELELKGKNFQFPIGELEKLAIYKGGLPGSNVSRKPDNTFYGNNWIVFSEGGDTHTYEFALDSGYKEERLNKTMTSLSSRYKQVCFIDYFEKTEEYGT